MSIHDVIERALRAYYADSAEPNAIARELLDSHRAAIVAEAKVETVGWLVKKAREYRATGGQQHALQADVIAALASKVDRGAVRAFIGTAHYRDVMDEHRAEVLAKEGQAYPGELDMLRGLIATMHAVAEHGDLDDVRKLLAEHRADDQAARSEWGKASATTPTATPTGPTGRVGQLLDAIRTARGEWPVHRAIAFYRDTVPALRSMPHRHLRTVARGDLRDLTAWGHLQRHDLDGARRFYTLKTRKDGA